VIVPRADQVGPGWSVAVVVNVDGHFGSSLCWLRAGAGGGVAGYLSSLRGFGCDGAGAGKNEGVSFVPPGRAPLPDRSLYSKFVMKSE